MENRGESSCCIASRDENKSGAPIKTKKSNAVPDLKGMILLEGGSFLMGTNDQEGFSTDGEGPVREVKVGAFYLESTTVSNSQFKSFIDATGYVTESERFGWSFVFFGLLSQSALDMHPKVVTRTPWWCAIPGAKWDQPEGPDSDISHRMDHPVVHVSWNDAQAYCQWSGKRLPSEAEWEYAARGGLVQKAFPWGDELTPGGKHFCNIWQGNFPDYNSLDDGFLGTSPVKTFQPNNYGFYNMAGNVWEWCGDWFSRDFHLSASRDNPQGPLYGTSRVMRGGSFLCHRSYCNRYRVAARSSNTPDSSTSNLGFRCAMDVVALID